MFDNNEGKGVTVSVKVYERLLAAYPADFRREYGPAMKQLFRDQCREAWSQAQGRGLTILWLRVLPDLAKTSVVEHLANRADAGPRSAFVRVFAVVLVCMFGFSICQMFWTPKVYASHTIILLREDTLVNQVRAPHRSFLVDPYVVTTQCKIITTFGVLSRVITNLNLQHVLARQAGETDWSSNKTYDKLVQQVDVPPPRGGDVIDISVKNPDPKLAADIANAIVGAYRKSLAHTHHQALEAWRSAPPPNSVVRLATDASVVLYARPTQRPIHPMPQIFSKWMFAGTLAALVAGGAGAWFAYLIRGFPRRQGTPS